jgi:nicotinamidase-related amidase
VLLDRQRAGLIVIDIQKKILEVMADSKSVKENAVKLIRGFFAMELPVLVTEQYPEGLGSSIDEIKSLFKEPDVLQKLTFSCCGVKGFATTLRKKKLDQIVLCGIETHVCVWQTAMDLLNDGFSVYVAADGVSSRKISDYETALRRMSAAGIHVTSTEMALFELLKSVEDPAFKTVHKLIK